MRVYVETYGCAQNQGEGAAIGRDLECQGHALVDRPERADAAVLVTCAVIGPTEARMVRRWRALSQAVPRVIVTGCLVPLRSDLLHGPGRERTTLVPIRDQPQIPGLLAVPEVPRDGAAPPTPVDLVMCDTRPPVTAEVVIAQGCTSGCSYCFSRLARGSLSSTPLVEVARRVRAAVGRGAVEIRLTSLDTAAWGRDRRDGARLPDLLRAVAEVPGEFKVRVGMMSPQSLAPILPDYLAALDDERNYRFLHLPVQSGSDRVLDAMHRGYTVDEFRHQVTEARRRFPDLMLSTDAIVGFPGETEDDHRATEQLVESVAPETVNVTRFSARPGTPAARLTPLAPRVVKQRSRSLTALRLRVARHRLEQWIGRTGRGRVVEHGAGTSAVARLSNYLPVVLGSTREVGAALDLRIDGARSTYLLGRPADASI